MDAYNVVKILFTLWDWLPRSSQAESKLKNYSFLVLLSDLEFWYELRIIQN